jgi:hypothetical protein
MSTPALTDSPSHPVPRALNHSRYPSAFPLLIAALFLLLCGTFIFRHALWRDEAQAFLLGRDSHSLGQLLYNLRYEGHPPLWHFLIFLLTRLTPRPEAMQAMHLLMAAGSVYLVARYSPFPWPIKILFPFGYFPIFEYGIISRNYQLFLLLTLALCALWHHRRFSFLWTGILLALLCLTHVLGDILAAGLGMMFLADALFTRAGRSAIRQHPWRFLSGLLIAGAGAAASVHCLIPPPDTGFMPGWTFQWDLDHFRDKVSTLWLALVPIPERTVNFWNTNILDDALAQYHGSLALAAAAILCLIHSWRALLVFLIVTVGSIAFFYIKLSGDLRHDGVHFVALIAAFWIAWTSRRRPSPAGGVGPSRFLRFTRATLRFIPRLALFSLLAVHVYAAGIALYYCWGTPFSPGKQAAACILKVLQPGDILVAESPVSSTSVEAYLPPQLVYYPGPGRWGNFAIWDQTSNTDASLQEAMPFIRKQNHPVIFISSSVNGPSRNAQRLGTFSGAIEDDEAYTIYRIAPPTRSHP